MAAARLETIRRPGRACLRETYLLARRAASCSCRAARCCGPLRMRPAALRALARPSRARAGTRCA
eukprot:1925642-Prymnesium_polylepis.1